MAGFTLLLLGLFSVLTVRVRAACNPVGAVASAPNAFTVTTKSIVSYAQGDTCSYGLTAPASNKLLIQLLTVDVGNCGGSMETLGVFDGTANTDTALKTAASGCADGSSPLLTSSGIRGLVELDASAASSASAGSETFQIKYLAGRNMKGTCVAVAGGTPTALTATATAAWLTSNAFPGDATAEDCYYKITATTTNYKIRVNLIFIDITGTAGSCAATDYLEFYDGVDNSATVLGVKRCGTSWTAQQIDSTGSSMALHFKATTGTVKGFAMSYIEHSSGISAKVGQWLLISCLLTAICLMFGHRM